MYTLSHMQRYIFDTSAAFTMWNTNSYFFYGQPRPNGSMVGVSDSWPSGCEFDTKSRRNFFPAYFRFSPLLKHVRKVVGGFGKKKLCEY